ncbi:MAG TPA: DUF2934 domain-containing protein [Steroidobacteraceae bacterium]
MIAEAAYYLAQRRGFHGKHALDDWLAAEQQVRQAISPVLDSEASMSNATRQNQRNADPKAREARFEKFAATQAAGDGIEGDALKPGKTVDEKLAANMADRK